MTMTAMQVFDESGYDGGRGPLVDAGDKICWSRRVLA